MRQLLIFCSLFPLINWGQCTIEMVDPVTPPTISCGESIDLEVLGYITGPGLTEDFNGGGLAPGWTSSQPGTFANPCGPTLDGTPAMWFGNVPTPRNVTTPGFDVSCGGQLCFDMDMGSDDVSSINDCEEPDQPDEGIHVQFSVDGGATWTDMEYYQPTTNGTGPYFTWANYCIDIPAAAYSLNTMFRWEQTSSSGAIYDHWGIDNFQLFPNPCGAGYYYLWNNQPGDQDTTVGPYTSTNYLVEYTNGIDDTCSINIPLTVEPFNVDVNANTTTINCGDCATANVALVPMPTIPGASYTISWTPANIVSSTSSISTNACPPGDQMLTATVTEGNSGCWGADSIFITVNPLDPAFSYPITSFCNDNATVTPTITGDPGGLFSANSPDIALDPNTGDIDPINSLPGVYDITYTPHPNCIDNSTVSIEIFPLPAVDAGTDLTLCPGDDAVLNGSGATTYVWDNGVTDGQTFSPTTTQTYTVIGTDNNGCESTDDVIVNVLPSDDPSFSYVAGLDYCMDDNNPVTDITGLAGGLFSYTPLNGSTTIDLNSTTGEINLGTSNVGTYEIMYNTTVLNLCPDSSTLVIELHANPDATFTANAFTGCAPQQIIFNTTNTSMTDQCVWDFSNGASSFDCDYAPANFDAGVYDITVTVTSEIGCQSTLTYNDYIDITAVPVAEFSPSLSVTNIEFTEISFNNYSSNASTYYWTFGEAGTSSTEIDPVYIYPETPEQYIVTLLAYSDNGLCADSTQKTIRINDILTYYVPNTFTPNGDAFNNEFKPVFTSGFDYWNFHMTLFNRYGEIIFESFNSDQGWDGTYGGKIVPEGVYIWQIEFGEELNDKIHAIRGHVTVLK